MLPCCTPHRCAPSAGMSCALCSKLTPTQPARHTRQLSAAVTAAWRQWQDAWNAPQQQPEAAAAAVRVTGRQQSSRASLPGHTWHELWTAQVRLCVRSLPLGHVFSSSVLVASRVCPCSYASRTQPFSAMPFVSTGQGFGQHPIGTGNPSPTAQFLTICTLCTMLAAHCLLFSCSNSPCPLLGLALLQLAVWPPCCRSHVADHD